MRKKKKRINRSNILVLAMILVFFLLFARLVYLQIFLHGRMSRNVDRMVNREKIEVPKRGDILDAKGKVLATSVKKYNVFLDAKLIDDFETLKRVLFENGIKIKEKNLTDFNNRSYISVAFNVDSSSVDKIKKMKLKGTGFETRYVRQYPEKRLLSHVLGVAGGDDGGGLEGVEKICNESLSGKTIKSKMMRDGRGYIIRKQLIDSEKNRGYNVYLTIDRNIQFIVEQELKKAFDKYEANKAICIVQDPKTGKILAMVSLPNFDCSDKIRDLRSLRNSAISDVYEPGSTLKIVTVAAALEEDKVKLSDCFYLEDGKLKIAGHTMKDDHKTEGSVSLSRAFEISSNIGMVKIAQKLGNCSFYDYIRRFGFYSLSGIDLPGESKGLLKDVKRWDVLTLPSISFGQGVSVTPLQLINAFSALANDGVLLRPFVVQKITKCNFEEEVFGKKEIRRVVSEDTAKIMKKLLKNAVDFGTGKSAKIQGYTVGGKTGTAQKFDPATKTYSTKHYIASFCGMVPAMNPEFVVLVIIDEPRGGSYYASLVASPVFANIAQRVAEYMEIEKDDSKS